MSGSRHTLGRRITRIARGQHNVFTYEQARAVGFGADAIDYRVRAGVWERQHEGVYSLAGRLTPEGHWLAAVFAGGEGAVLSHRSAAGLWRIAPLLVLPVHVIVRRQKRRRPGFVPHRNKLAPGDVTLHNGIPVTTVARTIADLPLTLRDDAAIKARVLRLLEDGGPRYRSILERDVHRIVLELGLRPEVNYDVEGRERDLVWPEEKVVMEIDGPHHEHPAQQAEDEKRDRELTDRGWRSARLRAG